MDALHGVSSYIINVNAYMYCAQVLLWLGREMRPQALWGYYHYPYCHDYQHGNPNCKPQVWSNKGLL